MKIFYLEYSRKKLIRSFKYLGNIKGKKREERFSKSTSQVDLKIFYLEYSREKLIKSFKFLSLLEILRAKKRKKERFRSTLG